MHKLSQNTVFFGASIFLYKEIYCDHIFLEETIFWHILFDALEKNPPPLQILAEAKGLLNMIKKRISNRC